MRLHSIPTIGSEHAKTRKENRHCGVSFFVLHLWSHLQRDSDFLFSVYKVIETNKQNVFKNKQKLAHLCS